MCRGRLVARREAKDSVGDQKLLVRAELQENDKTINELQLIVIIAAS